MTFVVRENVSLAEFTTLKVGGAARFFVQAANDVEVVEAIKFAAKNDLKVFILGGGSNVLIADRGFDGLVLRVVTDGISVSQKNDETFVVTAQAGEDWDELVGFCIGKNLQGFECLSGIPGLVGGTPVQNVGAYGQEVAETIVSVKVLERSSGKIVEILNSECRFSYRASIFNTVDANRFIVLSVSFALKLNGEPKIIYKDLQRYFGAQKPSLAATRQAVLEIRRAKSMIIDSNDENSRSAGSFFKNPIVAAETLAQINEKFSKLIPNFLIDENSSKIPAAWLIENAGFQKGFRRGRVGISTRHTLAIVNLGGASAGDVIALQQEIQKEVQNQFGILLKPEPVFVGF